MKPALWRLLLCGMLLSAAVGLLLLLHHAKFSSTFENRLQHRIAITAKDAAEALEGQIALGIPLSDTPALNGLLARSRQADPAIEALTLFDARGQHVLTVGSALPQLPRQALAGLGARRHGQARHAGHAALAIGLTNAFEVQAGALVLQYRLEEAQTNTREAFASLLRIAILALGGALVLLMGLMWVLRPRGEDTTTGGVAGGRLTLLLSMLLLGVQGTIALDAYRSLDRLAVQEAPSLAAALAHTLEPTLQRALASGIPLDELQGTGSWLRSALETGPEFAALTLIAPSGETLAESTRPTESQDPLLRIELALGDGTTPLARLRVGLDPRALAERTRQMAIEFLMLLLTGGLLIHEVLRALTSAPAGADNAGQDDAQALRFPLFLFFLGSELPRAFLPVWADELAWKSQAVPAGDGPFEALLAPLQALPHSLLASLPISAFLLAVALSSPLAGRYCARAGARRLLRVGLVFALAGHVLAALADAMPVLMLARILAGISFGCVSLAALDLISQQGGGRAAGMAMYLAAYVSAGIAGSGLGALIFDRAGTPAVFGAGILCSAVAALALMRLPAVPPRESATPSLSASIGLLLRTRGFQKLILLASLPLQIVQQGLLFYWAPLAILSIGETTSLTGLAMMAYFAIVLLLNKPLARLADRNRNYRVFLAWGLALAGVAGLLGIAGGAEVVLELLTPYRALMILSAIVLIGVAWALAFPSQGAMALALSRSELPGVDSAITLGVYRTIERFGAMITPILTAALIALLGLSGTAVAMGTLLLACALAQSRFQRLATP